MCAKTVTLCTNSVYTKSRTDVDASDVDAERSSKKEEETAAVVGFEKKRERRDVEPIARSVAQSFGIVSSQTKASAMYLYLIRHAQSANNALAEPGLHNPGRSSDPGLTERGKAQAEALRKRFELEREATPTRSVEVWSSPMRRCLLTSSAVGSGLGVRVRVRSDLHEHGGCFEGARGGEGAPIGHTGMTRAEIAKEFPICDAPKDMENGWWDPSRGCESVVDAQSRVDKVSKWLWGKARAMHDGDEPRADVYVVAHGMFIDILLKTLFDSPRTTGKQSSLFCSQNACVHRLHFDIATDGPCVGFQVFNDVTHLAQEIRSGGSVAGLDVAYTKEGSA